MVCCLRKNLKAKAPLLQGETRVASEDVKPQDIYYPKIVHLISSTECLLPKDLFVFSLLLLSTLPPHWLSAGDLASYVSKNIEAIRFKLSHLLTIISSSCSLAFAPSSNSSYSEEEAPPPRTPTPTLQASLSAWTLGRPRNPTLCHIPSVSCISSLSLSWTLRISIQKCSTLSHSKTTFLEPRIPSLCLSSPLLFCLPSPSFQQAALGKA